VDSVDKVDTVDTDCKIFSDKAVYLMECLGTMLIHKSEYVYGIQKRKDRISRARVRFFF